MQVPGQGIQQEAYGLVYRQGGDVVIIIQCQDQLGAVLGDFVQQAGENGLERDGNIGAQHGPRLSAQAGAGALEGGQQIIEEAVEVVIVLIQ